MQNINDTINANEDLKACIQVGIEIETSIEKDGDNYNFVVKTKKPVSILRYDRFNIYSIIQKNK